MKITIDTNEDSPEHIAHMVEFLQKFTGKKEQGYVGMFDGDSSDAAEPVQEGIFGMFGDDQAPKTIVEPDEPKPEKKSSSIPRIEIF